MSLRPGDGIIHSWLNSMLLPDTVGTGGDSHTRFPVGISFPAGLAFVAFAAATGVMPLDMPESVLVRFTGDMQPGITLRDLVHAIPHAAIQRGLLTVEKQGKKNVFSGRVSRDRGPGPPEVRAGVLRAVGRVCRAVRGRFVFPRPCLFCPRACDAYILTPSTRPTLTTIDLGDGVGVTHSRVDGVDRRHRRDTFIKRRLLHQARPRARL